MCRYRLHCPEGAVKVNDLSDGQLRRVWIQPQSALIVIRAAMPPAEGVVDLPASQALSVQFADFCLTFRVLAAIRARRSRAQAEDGLRGPVELLRDVLDRHTRLKCRTYCSPLLRARLAALDSRRHHVPVHGLHRHAQAAADLTDRRAVFVPGSDLIHVEVMSGRLEGTRR